MKLQHLEETRRQLDLIPPLPENYQARRPLLERLDALFGEPESENDPALNCFYCGLCRRVITENRNYCCRSILRRLRQNMPSRSRPEDMKRCAFV